MGGGELTQVAPGQEVVLRFKATRAYWSIKPVDGILAFGINTEKLLQEARVCIAIIAGALKDDEVKSGEPVLRAY